MNTEKLLLEIGTEEIPARFIPNALNDLYNYTKQELNLAHIEHGEITVMSTPRRLLVCVEEVEIFQKSIEEKIKGPLKTQAFNEEGKPTKAALGFAKSKGISPENLKIELINNVEYMVATIHKEVESTINILPNLLEKIIRNMSFPKNMYWENKNIRFARPVRWLLAIFGAKHIDISFGNVKSGQFTRGHRFMGASHIKITNVKDYFNLLLENNVIVDPGKRKEMILDGVKEIEKTIKANIEVDQDLLEEIVHLNEYPVVFFGEFNNNFLEIPEEVLILTMAKNQRYFPVRDRETSEKLLPYFIGVSNNLAKDMNVIKEGNERVLSARLYDAAFFWKEDLKRTLDEMAVSLKNITYQEKLGSLYEKVQRTKSLALALCKKLKKDDILFYIDRATTISKADVVSNMVCEFPEVQGVMAREYARKAKEHDRVSLALYEQYLPRFAGDNLPSDSVGAIIGLAERVDTIISIFKIGQIPTSTHDPYALRRAARCINELIWGFSFDIDLMWFFKEAAQTLNVEVFVLEEILSFLDTRLEVQLIEKGLDRNVVLLSKQTIPHRPLQILRLAESLQKINNQTWFSELIISAVRVKNILAKNEIVHDEIDTSLFISDSEKKLNDELNNLTKIAKEAIEMYDWESLSITLANLSPVISNFFEEVLVMDENLRIRKNRFALLSKCHDFFMQIGDFSLLK